VRGMTETKPSGQSCNFFSPENILVGIGTLSQVGPRAKRICSRKALIITDTNMKRIGMACKLEELLTEERVEVDVFDRIEAEPGIQTVADAAETVRSHDYDCIIGLGGGSCLDTAKVTSILATNGGQINDYVGRNKVRHKALPKILIPTTAGTGSEVTTAAVVAGNHAKLFVFDQECLPELAIVDPTSMTSLPAEVTAYTGMDALSHAVESLLTTDSNPLTEAVAFEAIRLVFRFLRIAYVHGDDLQARLGMAYAAALGGLAVNAGASWAHSFSYTVGPRFKIAHGLACGTGLPYSMELSLSSKAEVLSRVAQAAGEDTQGLTTLEAAGRAVSAIKRLLEDLHIPLTLNDLKVVPKEILPELARDLVRKYPRPTSPRQLTEADAEELYRKMWRGDSVA